MTFEELLDQAIALLQRRGRVAYRTLKRQFNLDDDVLEDLKVEIIRAQRLAVDEDGEVLVWKGGASPIPAPIAPPSVHQEEPPAAPYASAVSPAAETRSSDAERRQLTVLFVTWWTPPCSPASSTLKSCARWYGPIKTPAPR